MSANPPDALAELGEPFLSYARALLAADDAAKRLLAARVRGKPHEIAAALVDREQALAAVERIKHHLATGWLMAQRFARELFPGQVDAITGGLSR